MKKSFSVLAPYPLVTVTRSRYLHSITCSSCCVMLSQYDKTTTPANFQAQTPMI